MSTFIVRFVDESAQSFRGKVRHVTSGEEVIFADERGLLAFFERMNALRALALANAELVDAHRAVGVRDEASGFAAPSASAAPDGDEDLGS